MAQQQVCEWVLALGYWRTGSSKCFRFLRAKTSSHSPECLPCPHLLPSQGEEPSCPCSPGNSSTKEKSPWDWKVTDSEDMINYSNWQNCIPLVTFNTVYSASRSPLPFLPAPSSSSPCGHVPARDLFLPLCSLLNVFYSQPPAPGPLINY